MPHITSRSLSIGYAGHHIAGINPADQHDEGVPAVTVALGVPSFSVFPDEVSLQPTPDVGSITIVGTAAHAAADIHPNHTTATAAATRMRFTIGLTPAASPRPTGQPLSSSGVDS